MDDSEPQNPIVAMAQRIRARKDLASAVDSATPDAEAPASADDASAALAAFGEALRTGCKRLNSILGPDGVRYVRLEKPLRLRLRFRDLRVALDLDESRQLVIVRGLGLDGEYQFDPGSSVPALVNLSKLSTDAGYREPLTPNALVKTIARDAEIPRPAHLDALGPIQL